MPGFSDAGLLARLREIKLSSTPKAFNKAPSFLTAASVAVPHLPPATTAAARTIGAYTQPGTGDSSLAPLEASSR